MYYENEVPIALVQGTDYTMKEIALFIHENKDAVILSDESSLNQHNSEIRFKVVSVDEKYMLGSGDNGVVVFGRPIKKIYKIQRI